MADGSRRPGADTGSANTLNKAIEGGLARAMGLLGEACSVRDSRRRAALGTDYAVGHPVRPAKEGKDPTDRFSPKQPRLKAAKAGSPWRSYGPEDEASDAEPLDRPSRAVLAKVKAVGFVHDAGAGSFLGRTVEVFDSLPPGSLMLREAGEEGGFWLHPPQEDRARKARASRAAQSATPNAPAAGDVDMAKDQALLNAFSQAIAAAMFL